MKSMVEIEEPVTKETPNVERPGAAPDRSVGRSPDVAPAARPIYGHIPAEAGNGAPIPGQNPTEVHAEVEAETHILTVENFKLHYGKREALHGINMKIAGGKVTALIGPSGCGKSTLLRSMNRLNDLVDGVRVEGDMRFKGQSIYDKNVDVIELRKRLGMVF